MQKYGFILLSFVILLPACAPPPGESGPKDASVESSSTTEPETLVMNGLFTYMADAAQFRDCRSGRSYPVSMEADYLALERAYLGARSEPGAPVFATIEGSILERPAMEGGPRPHVVVTRLKSIDPGRRCE
jgi:uncharacterized lipoprotein NlpE involved in copper resistance